MAKFSRYSGICPVKLFEAKYNDSKLRYDNETSGNGPVNAVFVTVNACSLGNL